MSFSLDVEGGDAVNKAINKYAETAEDAVKEEIEYTTARIQNEARDNAPEVTGDLVDSYQTKIALDGMAAKVYSRLAYSRRIELGCEGTDSLGREYSQSGQYPLTRAFEDVVQGFERRLQNRL